MCLAGLPLVPSASRHRHHPPPPPSTLKKLGKYYDYYNSKGCEKEWNFKQFRVIVMQRTEARRENLLRALTERYNHRMFWLVTEESYHRDFAASIFKMPRDFWRKQLFSFVIRLIR
jgi:hypothetical protein